MDFFLGGKQSPFWIFFFHNETITIAGLHKSLVAKINFQKVGDTYNVSMKSFYNINK